MKIVTSVKDGMARVLNEDEYVKEEVMEGRQDLQDYLKGRRKQVMKIADKRREKSRNDEKKGEKCRCIFWEKSH